MKKQPTKVKPAKPKRTSRDLTPADLDRVIGAGGESNAHTNDPQ